MNIEIFERTEEGLEYSVYNIDSSCERVLIDKSGLVANRKVWGFTSEGDQKEGTLVSFNPNQAIIA